MKTINYILMFAILLVFGCANKKQQTPQKEELLPAHKGEIRITGAYALMPLAQRWITQYQKIHPTVQFNLTPTGSGDAIQNIFSENADLVMISSELNTKLEENVWMLPVARLSVVLIANEKNPFYLELKSKGIKKDELFGIFTGEKKFWGDLFDKKGQYPISIYFRSDKAGTTDVLSRYLWLDDLHVEKRGVTGEYELLEKIKADPLALTYCNFIYTFDPESKQFYPEITIVPLDLNQNDRLDSKENFYQNYEDLQRAMWLGKYPCILTRPLHFVATEKPATKEVHDFLKWVLTDGQATIAEMGYIELHSSEIKRCMSYLEN